MMNIIQFKYLLVYCKNTNATERANYVNHDVAMYSNVWDKMARPAVFPT